MVQALDQTVDINPHDVMGSVHSWELVTAVDGPGTRLTVFLSGCPLRCLYCHNPDTRFTKWGTQMSAASVLARLDRYAPALKATGGGLTISGGEPMMQPKFLRALIDGAKERGIHVAMDTSGYLGKFISDDVINKVDLFLLDIKSGIEETHKKTTGRKLQPTLDFSQRLASLNKDVWIRFVLVPGLTDGVENVEATAQHIVAMGSSVKRVEVLPFHQMGRSKWEEVGLTYELEDVKPPSVETVQRVVNQFKSHGLPVTVG